MVKTKEEMKHPLDKRTAEEPPGIPGQPPILKIMLVLVPIGIVALWVAFPYLLEFFGIS